ncbi:MAG: tRNA epoxyqueuosine(34) reductase QueG [Gemmobacter sp.]
MEAGSIEARLKSQAEVEGFAACGICAADALGGGAAGEGGAAGRLAAWLAAEHHGTMGWMAARAEARGDPRVLWPAVRSVVMLADSYAPAADPLAVLADRTRGAVSVYAQGRDYHDRIKPRLKRLARWLIAEAGGDAKVFVDTAPVMEKPLAQAAGLGWQGKHTNLLGRGFGNWVFLGAVFSTLDLMPDVPEGEHCGRCTACLDICPTRAFPAPHVLDARRCISYLTIEHKGPVDEALRGLMGNRIYGCDDCLAVCPWNKFAVSARETGYAAREAEAPALADLALLDDAGFRARFAGSPVKRIGRGRFVRNVLYAIGNSGQAALRPVAAARGCDDDPVVADAARWAVARLS